MKEIRLGTIGSGAIVRSILDNVKLTEGIKLEAVYSRTEEKGRGLASDYGVDKVYTSLEALFADEDVNLWLPPTTSIIPILRQLFWRVRM